MSSGTGAFDWHEPGFLENRRVRIREALFGSKAPGESWEGIAEDWQKTPEQAANDFADALPMGLPPGLAADKSEHQRVFPSRSDLRDEAKAVYSSTRKLRRALNGASHMLVHLVEWETSPEDPKKPPLDLSQLSAELPLDYWPRGTPSLCLNRLWRDLTELERASREILRQVEPGEYAAPTEHEIRREFIGWTMQLYHKHFGCPPGLSRSGPFVRVLLYLLAELRGADDALSDAIYEDALEVRQRLYPSPAGDR